MEELDTIHRSTQEQQRQHRNSYQEIVFDLIPLQNIKGSDRVTIQNVFQIISSIHHPKISILKGWRIEEEDEKYNIVVPFPKNTPFTCNQLCLIEQINQYLIG